MLTFFPGQENYIQYSAFASRELENSMHGSHSWLVYSFGNRQRKEGHYFFLRINRPRDCRGSSLDGRYCVN